MADDKELEAIIQGMIDAGESEEDMAAVIQAYHAPKPGSGLNKPIKSPTSFWGGVADSLTSGEAAMAGLKGLGGFAKGAIVDLIPDTVTGMVDMARASHYNPNIADRIATTTRLYEGLKDAPSAIAEATMKAGSKPYEFGEMTGKIMGQPAVGALAGKIPLPTAAQATKPIRALGNLTKGAGNLIRNNTPVSRMVPKMMSIPLAADVESAVGSGIARVGDRASKVGIPKVLRNSDYGPMPFEGGPGLTPTAEMKGGMSYPPLNEAPEMIPNAVAAADEFMPGEPLISPTGSNKGSMAYPELNDTPPSLMTNADYGPVEFTPDGPLSNPTGPNKGGMAYPELADTPPSLVPNSQAAMDEFMQSVSAPTGEMRGSMAFPETNPMDPRVMHNSDYGPGYSSSPERVSDWGSQTPNANRGNPWAEPSPEPTTSFEEFMNSINESNPETLPPAQEWMPQAQEWAPPAQEYQPHFIEEILPQTREYTPPAPEMPAAREWKPPTRSEPTLDVIEDSPISNNASGESGASMEAMSRLKAMASKGEKFVVIDRAGRARPLIGADAVDYVPQIGETFGIQGPGGFKPLSSNKGFVPKHLLAQ